MKSPTPLAFHLVARTVRGCRPFIEPEPCHALWNALRRTFPGCYAAILMPNHFHIVVPPRPDLRARIGIVMRSVSRGLGPTRIRWEHSPLPDPIVDSLKLWTTIRYVHLNPARAGLSADPLAWSWSTLRDYLGLSLAPPWVDTGAIARLRGLHTAHLQRSLLEWTLNDPCVSQDARRPLLIPQTPLERTPSAALLREAIAIALLHPTPTREDRILLTQACRDLGRMTAPQIVRELRWGLRSVRRYLAQSPRADHLRRLQIIRTLVTNPRLTSVSVQNGTH